MSTMTIECLMLDRAGTLEKKATAAAKTLDDYQGRFSKI